MHLFTAVVVDGDERIKAALADTGFLLVPMTEFDGEDRFFCAITSSSADNDLVWTKWRPKLIFAGCKDGVNSGIYSWQTLCCGKEEFLLGVLPEREFVIAPDWYLDYATQSDDLAAFLKMLADYSYRYLLAEIMDETAQWCGHMSSVVHKL